MTCCFSFFRNERLAAKRKPDRRACSAMMYSRDQPNIFSKDCMVHNRVSYPDLEAAERERMWEAREARAAGRERSASLPSGDISVR